MIFSPQVKKASHIHIHDNHGMSDEHLALGDGTINWNGSAKQFLKTIPALSLSKGDPLKKQKRVYRYSGSVFHER